MSFDGSVADLDTVWSEGSSYRLNTEGNVRPLDSEQTLVDVIGEAAAVIVRDAMRTVRPRGGRFKLDQRGVMVTLVDGETLYVCTVTREGWFPAHWK